MITVKGGIYELDCQQVKPRQAEFIILLAEGYSQRQLAAGGGHNPSGHYRPFSWRKRKVEREDTHRDGGDMLCRRMDAEEGREQGCLKIWFAAWRYQYTKTTTKIRH